jgi:hypothetical protein
MASQHKAVDPVSLGFRGMTSFKLMRPTRHGTGAFKVKLACSQDLFQGDHPVVGIHNFCHWIQCFDDACNFHFSGSIDQIGLPTVQ